MVAGLLGDKFGVPRPQEAESCHGAFLPICRSLYLFFCIRCQDKAMHACTDHWAPTTVAHGVAE